MSPTVIAPTPAREALRLACYLGCIGLVAAMPLMATEMSRSNHPWLMWTLPVLGVVLFGPTAFRAFLGLLGQRHPLVVSNKEISGATLHAAVRWEEVEAAWVEHETMGPVLHFEFLDLERAQDFWADRSRVGRLFKQNIKQREVWTEIEGYDPDAVELAVAHHAGM